MNLLPDGNLVPAKKFVEHNHENEEEAYKELKALTTIKKDCVDMSGILGGSKTNLSSIRRAFRRTCER